MRGALVIVAKRLLPVFLTDSRAWEAVRYLNRWSEPPKTSHEYLAAWEQAAPAELRGYVNQFRAVLSPLL